MVLTYYNEIDPFCAAWLKNLMAAGVISNGDIDNRSIEDVRPSDLAGYKRCHFFAGIGVWDYALRQAGWPEDREIWTGSCPCQPFSSAGKRKGFEDERHLWPVWFDLIKERRPDTLFGEQVSAAVRLGWLDALQANLEGEGYACGFSVFGAHSVGAPHVRQRLYWVADAQSDRQRSWREIDGRGGKGIFAERKQQGYPDHSSDRALANADGERSQGRGCPGECASRQSGMELQEFASRALKGFWRNADWLFCRDGKWRAVEPGSFPLADGIAAGVGRLRVSGGYSLSPLEQKTKNRAMRLRGYGNAVTVGQAVNFIEAFLDVQNQSL